MKTETLKTAAEKALQEFIDRWKDEPVLITGKNHPCRGEKGIVITVDYTNAGYGMRIKLDNGGECYVFKGSDLIKLPF